MFCRYGALGQGGVRLPECGDNGHVHIVRAVNACSGCRVEGKGRRARYSQAGRPACVVAV